MRGRRRHGPPDVGERKARTGQAFFASFLVHSQYGKIETNLVCTTRWSSYCYA